MANKNWIQGMNMNKGGLHRALGIPEGEKIPEKKLVKAEHSKDPHIRRMARTAETLKKLG
jgi:hypothetical protein